MQKKYILKEFATACLLTTRAKCDLGMTVETNVINPNGCFELTVTGDRIEELDEYLNEIG